jgi:hypothetical protein
MEWKYGDVFVIIQNQNTAVITAVVLGTRLSLETAAESLKTAAAAG